MIDEKMITQRLKEVFGDKGPSRIAAELDVPVSTISAYVNGVRSPKLKFMRLVSEHYNVNFDWLVGIPGAPKYLDFPGVQPDEDIVILSRAAKKMTPEERKKLLDMARLMFNDAFDEK